MARKTKHIVKYNLPNDPIPEYGMVRGGMVGAAEKYPIPDRFAVTFSETNPQVTFLDTKTGKKLTVGLCDYQATRIALNTFCE